MRYIASGQQFTGLLLTRRGLPLSREAFGFLAQPLLACANRTVFKCSRRLPARRVPLVLQRCLILKSWRVILAYYASKYQKPPTQGRGLMGDIPNLTLPQSPYTKR